MPALAAYSFDPVILREYDVRGQIGKNLSEQDAYALGHAFGQFVKAHTQNDAICSIAIGYDGRDSSPVLAEALSKGLTEVGVTVHHIGLGPTPMLYFAVKHLKLDAGVMITGSHNPSDYNGFKMMLQNAPVFGAMIQEIGTIATNLASSRSAEIPGDVITHDLRDTYITRLVQDLTTSRPLKIAWDNGNGAAGAVLKRLTDQLPGEHIVLFGDVDGRFPNHHPDPTVDANLKDLQAAVKAHNCDLGIAFDGDADRIGVVDENGTVLRCDSLMTLYAKEVLSAHPGAPIIGDVKCSQVMFDEIERLGGKAVMWKTGHSLIKDKMRELKAPLAGELSGHIFFADKYYGYDDALYCAIRLFNAMGETDGALSALTAHLPTLHSTPEIRFQVNETEKFELVPKMISSLKDQNLQDVTLDDIDGIRVCTADGWWLCRPSNTQDVLVARAEASSPEGLKRLQDMAESELEKLGYVVDFSFI